MASEAFDLSGWALRDQAAREAGAALVRHVHDKIPELKAILARHGAAEAYFFGSLVRGTPRRGSDVDMAVLGCPPAEFYRLASELERALGVALDLIDLGNAPVDFGEEVRLRGDELLLQLGA